MCRCGSGSVAPVVDASMVGAEAVLDTPQHGLGAAGDADLAVRGADVGLDRVRTEVGERGDVVVRFALGDQREDLRLTVAESLRFARPLEPDVDACFPWVGAD